MEVAIKHSTFRWLVCCALASVGLVIGCTATPTAAPVTIVVPTNPPPPPSATNPLPTSVALAPTATPNAQGAVIIAQLDPTRQVL
ncbi:MAG: hypothetical protein DCC52_07330, partial [Chloroflexi bacterium]